ncbi:MAG: protein kinase domain-containing protein [Acidimicrobiia bacterium]
MAQPHPLDVLTGRLLGGRYRLDALVATGGMAQVWEATDEVLTRRVAVKLLHPYLAADAGFIERFRREAVAAARLAHPSIISIYDTCSEAGVEAIVMELVQGMTLRRLLDERRFLEPGAAVAIVAEVAGALDAAHKAGVVHRDVKPANILLSNDGRVLVADFGIAKAGDDLTATGVTLGTAKYLAPEQVEGGAADVRSDVYALGVVLYEAICGRPPFAADSEAATALARLHQDPLKPRNVRAGIPKRLEDVVLRAMAREPDQRYESAGALRVVLLAASGDAGAPAMVTSDATRASADRRYEGGGEAAPARDRDSSFVHTERGWLVPVVVIVLVAVIAVLAGSLLAGDPPPAARGGPGTEATAVAGAGESGALPVSRAVAFDPPPAGDGSEHDDEVSLAFDGDPATTWETEGYQDPFPQVKPGVGLVLVLDRPSRIAKVEVTSPTAGWSAEVYVADQPAGDRAGWGEPVSTEIGMRPGTTTFELDGQRAGAVLIWVTDLGAGLRAAIGEARVIGADT